MPYTTGALNLMVDSLADVIDSVSLHSGDPGAAGTANELSGSGYARQSATWGAASSGTATTSGTVSFGVPAGTVAWAAFWTAAGPTFYASDQLDVEEVFAAAGTFNLTSAKLGVAGS